MRSTLDRLYDVCDSILSQKLSQVEGVGQVFVGGASPPAVRIEANPMLMNNLGVGMDQIVNRDRQPNANRPKGAISDAQHNWTITANDQMSRPRSTGRSSWPTRTGRRCGWRMSPTCGIRCRTPATPAT